MAGQRGDTVGVEEEFLLVDTATRRPVPHAAAVLEAARPAAGDCDLQAELARSQVEAASAVCTDLADLRDRLVRGRHALGAAAERLGDRLVSVGHPVLTGDPPGHAESARFDDISRIYAGMMRDYQACGCHVHVGVESPELAVAVLHQIRGWLPTLLALSVNSPFDGGVDTGYGSWRATVMARFPGAGLPPAVPTLRDYRRELDRLIDCGVLADRAMTFWLARPSEHLPTIEVRVADAALTPEEAVTQAGLVRALVRTAIVDVRAGRAAPPVGAGVGAAALWSAARYGMAGPGVDPWRCRRVPATDLVTALLTHVDDALDRTGDRQLVRQGVARVLRHGTGACRQRAAAGADPRTLVDWLAERTAGAG